MQKAEYNRLWKNILFTANWLFVCEFFILSMLKSRSVSARDGSQVVIFSLNWHDENVGLWSRKYTIDTQHMIEVRNAGRSRQIRRRLKFTACPGSIIWFRRCSCRSSYAHRAELRTLARTCFFPFLPCSVETCPRALALFLSLFNGRTTNLTTIKIETRSLSIRHANQAWRSARLTDSVWIELHDGPRLFRSIRHEIATVALFRDGNLGLTHLFSQP